MNKNLENLLELSNQKHQAIADPNSTLYNFIAKKWIFQKKKYLLKN